MSGVCGTGSRMRVADTPSEPHSRGPNLRLIARLDLKMDSLIKGVQFEGWRKVGDPGKFARRYYADGADELIFMDVVASLYERNNLTDIVRCGSRRRVDPDHGRRRCSERHRREVPPGRRR